MDMITGKGPSNRHEIFYFGESELGAVRIDDFKYRFIDQPRGWLGEKTKADVPYLVNLRLDPFERTGWPDSGLKKARNNTSTGSNTNSGALCLFSSRWKSWQ
jgi:arylsulfatase